MKEEITANSIKAAITVFFASFVAYFANVAAPLVVLLVVVISDYITGLIKAYTTRTLSSRIGFTGILKKLSYFVVVGVGMVVDYLISSGIRKINAEFTSDLSIVSIIVIIWLIINELLSILENLSDIGVPLPSFLKKLIERLLVTVEKKGDDMAKGKDEAKPEEEIVEETETEKNFFFKSDYEEIQKENAQNGEENAGDDSNIDDAPKGEM